MDKPKTKRIKNKQYRKFLDEGIINLITEEDIVKVLNNINGKHIREARSLVICLYLTGARPVEVLSLKAKDISKSSRYVLVKVPASKNGLPRTIYLPFKNPLVKELLNFAVAIMNERWLFYNFRGNYKRKYITKKGFIKEYKVVSAKLPHFFEKWFSILPYGSVPPYFLRHNRFSQLSQAGASQNELKHTKGAKSYDSIQHYLHMSEESAKKVARRIK